MSFYEKEALKEVSQCRDWSWRVAKVHPAFDSMLDRFWANATRSGVLRIQASLAAGGWTEVAQITLFYRRKPSSSRFPSAVERLSS